MNKSCFGLHRHGKEKAPRSSEPPAAARPRLRRAAPPRRRNSGGRKPRPSIGFSVPSSRDPRASRALPFRTPSFPRRFPPRPTRGLALRFPPALWPRLQALAFPVRSAARCASTMVGTVTSQGGGWGRGGGRGYVRLRWSWPWGSLRPYFLRLKFSDETTGNTWEFSLV